MPRPLESVYEYVILLIFQPNIALSVERYIIGKRKRIMQEIKVLKFTKANLILPSARDVVFQIQSIYTPKYTIRLA